MAAGSTHGGDSILVGVGALLGAAMLISTAVVAGILLQSGSDVPTAVPAAAFTRDAVFFLAALLLLLCVASTGSATILSASSFLGLYAFYVFFVFRLNRGGGNGSGGGSAGKRSGGSGDNVEMFEGASAFWHAEGDWATMSGGAEAAGAADDGDSEAGGSQSSESMREEIGCSAADAINSGSDDIFDDSGNGGGDNGYDKLMRSFSYTIHADHFSMPPDVASLMPGSMLGMALGSGKGGQGRSSEADGPGMAQPLLAAKGGPGGGGGGGGAGGRRHRLRRRRRGRKGPWASLYWQQWRVRRRLHRELMASEFWSKRWYLQVLHIAELPMTLARNATVPQVEAEAWSQPYAIVSVALAPLFLAVVAGWMPRKAFGVVPLWAVLPLGSVGLAVGMALTTHASRPPKARAGSLALVLIAFVACICWIYVIAGEVVAVLETVGTVTRFPASVLGLTVLAWGNSSGDFVTNLAVSRAGFPSMAIAGCYGGPLFNLLAGLGIPLLLAGCRGYPAPVAFALDGASTVTAVFIMMTLAATLVAVAAHGFAYPPWAATMLVSVYGAYMLAQALILLS
ncbi:unnamed protein product [Phaeothamnion confervicola]